MPAHTHPITRPRSPSTSGCGSPAPRRVVGYARAINRQKRVTKTRLGIAVRDAMLPSFLRKAADDTRNDWLYNHEIAWDAAAPKS